MEGLSLGAAVGGGVQAGGWGGGHAVRPSQATAVRWRLTQLSASSEMRLTDPRSFCPGGTFRSGEEELIVGESC